MYDKTGFCPEPLRSAQYVVHLTSDSEAAGSISSCGKLSFPNFLPLNSDACEKIVSASGKKMVSTGVKKSRSALAVKMALYSNINKQNNSLDFPGFSRFNFSNFRLHTMNIYH